MQSTTTAERFILCRLKGHCGVKVSTKRTLVTTFRSQQPMTRHAAVINLALWLWL